MNKNVETKNNEENEKKQKKSFLSGLIQVEDEKEKETSTQESQAQQTEIKQQPPKKKGEEKKEEEKEEEEKEDKGLSEEERLLVNTGEGVNLIPKKSKAEITKEKTKFSFSVSSMVSLAVLVILTLVVVLFNIISKQQLNSAKEKLYKREIQLEAYTDKMVSNEEILDRVDLYKHLQQGVFSPKEIVEYIMSVVNKAGNISIRTIDIDNNLGFEMNGSTTELSIVARLWYLLGTDTNIETINLNSVGKGDSGVSFSFEGELNTDKFIHN